MVGFKSIILQLFFYLSYLLFIPLTQISASFFEIMKYFLWFYFVSYLGSLLITLCFCSSSVCFMIYSTYTHLITVSIQLINHIKYNIKTLQKCISISPSLGHGSLHIYFSLHIYLRRTQKTWNLFIKYCVFILTCLNFSHLQSTLHLMQYTCWDFFSTVQNSIRTCGFWCLLVLLPFFVSPLPQGWNISLWGRFFWLRKTNK